MSATRAHTPSISLAEIEGLSSIFTREVAQRIADQVGIAPMPVPDDETLPAFECPPDELASAQLSFYLTNAANSWGWDQRKQTTASAKKRAELARQVAKDCRRLLARVTDDNGDLYSSLGPGGLFAIAAMKGGSGKEHVTAALNSVRDLQRWADGMAMRHESVEMKREKVRAGAPTDYAYHNLAVSLGVIYARFWGMSPGVSRSGKPTGPFYRFLKEALAELGLNKSEESIATEISRNPQLEALKGIMKDMGIIEI